MKTGTVVAIGCIMTLLLAGGTFAQDVPAKPATTNIQDGRTSNVADAEAMIGKKVESKDGKELGQVKKIVKNTTSGQAYAIIASANKLYPVPVNALSVKADKEKISLGIDKKKFSTAPSYPEGKMPDMTSPAINALVNSFYSQSPS